MMLTVLSLCLALAGAPSAEPDVPEENVFVLQPHAFLSQGAIVSTKNNYLGESKRLSLDMTEVGVNLTALMPTENLRAGIQLFGSRLGNEGTFVTRFDWFYLDYSPYDWFGLRAGRIKIPFGLYNDVSDIDAARAPILLPQSVYPIRNRDFLLAHTGLETHGYIQQLQLEYRLYFGTIALNTTNYQSLNVVVEKVNTPYLFGGRLLWDTPVPGLQTAFSIQRLRIDVDFQLDQGEAGVLPIHGSIPATLWMASAQYTLHDFQLTAEYGQWVVDVDSDQPEIIKPTHQVNERYYLMASYHFLEQLQGMVYYAGLFSDMSNRNEPGLFQHDIATGLRYDINQFWLVKLEGHYMNGTASVESRLNDGRPKGELPQDWVVFLAKTTLYF